MHSNTEVLVVGAGPVGLLLAAELRRHGVSCRIIDKLAERAGWVKALGVSQRTLEVWDDLGLVTEALDAGLTLRRQHLFVNRAQVVDADVAYPDEAPYKYSLLLPQPETERLLTTHLERLGGRIERGAELRSFVEDADGIQATVETSAGVETLRCRYLVGCDGARSTVRHQLGLPFEGGRFPVEFLLADAEIGWEFPHACACLFLEVRDEALENLLVCIPYKDRSSPASPRYRITTMATPVSATNWDESAPPVALERAIPPTLEQVREAVARFVPVPATVGDLRWSSVFRISHRIVPRYRVGRAFLGGDAAHIHPPTGGQGMNTGLQDAYNLAWKLALEVKGVASSDLLDSYSAERQPVGQAVVERTRQRSVNIGDRSQHDLDALRADSQLLVHYRNSAWVGENLSHSEALASGPKPGDRAPDASGLRRTGVEYPLRLFDLQRGVPHTLLLYGVGSTVEALLRRHGEYLRAYRIVSPDGAAPQDVACPVVVDSGGQFARIYA